VTTPGKGDDDELRTNRMAARIHGLVVDGYLRFVNGQYLLTIKGWAVLFAEAQPPMYKPKGKSP
jgi:hypothetical protein